MHLLLEGTDLQELLDEVRQQHGPAARVVRAERIRSGGVAGFFSKERYEVTVEMDGTGGDSLTAPAPSAARSTASGDLPEGPAEAGEEEREALDFEALLAAADAAETSAAQAEAHVEAQDARPAGAPAPVDADGARAAGEDFESARAGLLEVLRAQQGDAAPADRFEDALKVAAADAENPVVIAQTGDDQHAASTVEAGTVPQVEDGAAEAFEAALLEQARAELERAEAAEAAERAEAERLQAERVAAERAAFEQARAERAEAERAEAQRVAAERAAAERAAVEAERARAERENAERAAAERALEEERMQQQMERQHAEREERARRDAARAQEERRQQARADVRRRQAERVGQAPRGAAAPARSLGEVLAAADAAEGTDRLGAMFAAGQGVRPQPEPARQEAPRREAPRREPSRPEVAAAPSPRPHRPISTESDTFARTLAAMRSGATRTPATAVTADVRSVTTPVRSVRPRPGHPDARPARTPEERVSDQFGAANGATAREGRGPARRPELRRPAAVEEQFADQFGDQFGDRFDVERTERPAERRGEWAHDYDQLEQSFEQPYDQPFEQGYERQDERPARSYQAAARQDERTSDRAVNRNGDENEAMTMDLTYREPVTTYSDRSGSSRMAYREPQDTGDVLRVARDIDVPAPLRVGAGELVVVIGEADAVVAAALLVADEVGSEAPLVLGRADVQNTVTADELPARQDQARRWSAPLTVAIPARPTGADAERAARMAAEIGAASVVVCVDATRRSHAVASLLRALDGVGLPARRLAVHRAAESPDPLDVLSLDVPVGFLDGRPATSGAWAGLLLDAAGDQGLR